MAQLILYNNALLNLSRNVMYSESGTGDGGFASFLNNNSTNKYDITLNYIKIAADLYVKIPWNQEILDEQAPHWTYASIKNEGEGRLYYFYVVGMSWISANTIQLHLSMDTVATYWTDIQGSFTDKTTVSREHRDRFVKKTAKVGAVLTRNVDEVSEGIEAPQNKVKDEVIHREEDNHKWYLVYRTNTNDTYKPIDTWLCPSEQMVLNTTYATKTIYTSDLSEEDVIVFGYGTYTVLYSTDMTKEVEVTNNAACLAFNNDWHMTYYTTEGHYGTLPFVISITPVTGTYYTMNLQHFNEVYKSDSSTTSQIICDAKAAASLPYDKSVYESVDIGDVIGINLVNRTYQDINAVIECPYVPVEAMTVSGTTIVHYDKTILQYSKARRMFKFIDPEYNFSSIVSDNYEIPDMTYTLTSSDMDKTAARNDALESKIYHSDYNTIKFVYDSYSLPYNREYIAAPDNDVTVRIHYKQSNNMSSNLLFDIGPGGNTTYKANSDYPNILLSKRNNELTIYQSEYLNYMRTGYNYDKKQQELQTTSSIMNTIGSIVKAGASLGFGIQSLMAGKDKLVNFSQIASQTSADDMDMFQGFTQKGKTIYAESVKDLRRMAKGTSNPIASQMMINNSSGIIGSISSSIIQIASQQNAMNKQLANLKAQSVGVATSDDLNLFNYYGNNKLHFMEYDTTDSMKSLLYDMFYYLGYATNRQEIPDLYSRCNWNFIMCSPEWTTEKENIIPQDVKARFAAGITIFHNTADFDQTKNNSETWIVGDK